MCEEIIIDATVVDSIKLCCNVKPKTLVATSVSYFMIICPVCSRKTKFYGTAERALVAWNNDTNIDTSIIPDEKIIVGLYFNITIDSIGNVIEMILKKEK